MYHQISVHSYPRTGWPADLEFLKTWNSQKILWYLKKVREFHKIQKSQGINAKLGRVREFYLRETKIAKVFPRFIQVVNKI